MKKKYHFIGIGGISMSGLAFFLLSEGHEISGSDIIENDQTRELARLGVRISLGGARVMDLAENICHDMIVVLTGAIAKNDPELVLARGVHCGEDRKCDGKIIMREDLLLEISKRFKDVIAVAGSHGKSTTTAMIAQIFIYAGLFPTVHNGAVAAGDIFGLRMGGGDFFITEACEFNRSFLKLLPNVGVVTNVSMEHMDCYADMNAVHKAYKGFESNCETVIKHPLSGVTNVTDVGEGRYNFVKNGITYSLGVAGRHNVDNAALAIEVARHYGICESVIKDALESFRGIGRRFERLGRRDKLDIIIDYAHHPKEIETTIATATTLYDKFLIVFQPHTYTRTHALFDDFVRVFSGESEAKKEGDKSQSANKVILYKTYAAREEVIRGAEAYDLAKAIGAQYYDCKENLKENLLKQLQGGEAGGKDFGAIIFVGAGDIYLLAREVLANSGIAKRGAYNQNT